MKMILTILIASFAVLTSEKVAAADICDGADLNTDIICYCRKTSPTQMDRNNCQMCGNLWDQAEGICSSGAPIQSYSAPVQQSGSESSSCKSVTDNAVNICDQNKNSGMGQAMQMAEGLAAMMGSSPQSACSQFGKISAATNAAITTFSAGCSKEYLSCQNTCDSEQSDTEAQLASTPVASPQYEILRSKIASIKTDTRRCGALKQNLASAASGVEKLLQTNAMMAQCQALTGNSIAEMCAKDPNQPMCATQGPADCSNPSIASTNTTCICQVNPRDARCGLSAKGNSYTQSSTGGSGTDGLDAGSFGTGSLSGSDAYSDISFGSAGKPSDKNLLQGGAGGGKGGISGGGQNGGADVGGGRPGTGQSAKILNGYYGGKGGGAAGGGGSGSGNRGGYGAPGGGSGAGGNANVDLRQFMPGGKMDPQRGLAGISGPDGITGPHTDIWKKVNKRYFAVTPSLLP